MNSVMWLPIFVLVILIDIATSTTYVCNRTANCGCSTNSVSTSRIVGGEDAGSLTWNWAVSLSIGGQYLCGGSIISSSWVITAAHCLWRFSSYRVTIYAGSNQRWTGTQTRTAAQIIIHPGYDEPTYKNDIALLRLDDPFDMTDPALAKVCLPSIDPSILNIQEWPSVGTSVVAVGWGTLQEQGSLPTRLQQVTVQVVSHTATTCSGTISDWRLQFCAGVDGGGKDTCQGDSGGPLMIFTENNQWLLVGLTSYGIGCARPQYAGIYTRVAVFKDWINSYIDETSTTTLTTIAGSSTYTIKNSSSKLIYYPQLLFLVTILANIMH